MSYLVPSVGIRLATMRVTRSKGAHPRISVYPAPENPCTEKGFLLYMAGYRDELRIRAPTDSVRRMRRFLRD